MTEFQFPKFLRLGKCVVLATTGKLNDSLESTRGIAIMLFSDNKKEARVFLHGRIGPEELFEMTVQCMKVEWGIEFLAGMFVDKERKKMFEVTSKRSKPSFYS